MVTDIFTKMVELNLRLQHQELQQQSWLLELLLLEKQQSNIADFLFTPESITESLS